MAQPTFRAKGQNLLDPTKDTETTSEIRAVLSLYYSSYILSLYNSLFLSINHTSFI